jgi:pimeloyl-ACP methyl ester carboxylesterase
LKYDPRPNLQKVTVPVLVLNGTTDLQVVAEQNVPEVVKALNAAGNKSVTVKRLRNLNHLFQKSKTGDPSEYGTIETTLDPSLLKAIGDWFAMVVLKPIK